MAASIHPQAIVESSKIGDRTRIWAFAHILPGASIGEDCNICDQTFIENDVRVGDRVTLKCGVQLWDGITLEDDVFVGPNATFTNDLFPRSRAIPEKFTRTLVQRGASIGANATILAGVTVGPYSMVGAGAVVTRNVPPYAIVYGNPARIRGYVQSEKESNVARLTSQEGELQFDSKPLKSGAVVQRLPKFVDLRGSLCVAEVSKHIPFTPRRFFTVFDVPTEEVRGEHAHRECHQYLVCIKGHCSLVTDNGHARDEIVLSSPSVAVHIPPMVWGTQYRYSADAVLLVMASHPYQASDYIRNYDEFIALTRN